MPYNYEDCYRGFNGKWIYLPTKQCRAKAEQIIAEIDTRWSPPDFYFHFKAGGHIAAVQAHKGYKFFAKLDLKSFFPNITKNKVIRALRSVGFPYKAAKNRAEWSCVPSRSDRGKYSLPYGFVQSQFIAALCMDKSALGNYMRENIPVEIEISVYVDDILLSSNDEEKLNKTYEELSDAIRESNFTVNEGKSHSSKPVTTAFNIVLEKNNTSIAAERFEVFCEDVLSGHDKKNEAIINYVSKVNSKQKKHLENL